MFSRSDVDYVIHRSLFTIPTAQPSRIRFFQIRIPHQRNLDSFFVHSETQQGKYSRGPVSHLTCGWLACCCAYRLIEILNAFFSDGEPGSLDDLILYCGKTLNDGQMDVLIREDCDRLVASRLSDSSCTIDALFQEFRGLFVPEHDLLEGNIGSEEFVSIWEQRVSPRDRRVLFTSNGNFDFFQDVSHPNRISYFMTKCEGDGDTFAFEKRECNDLHAEDSLSDLKALLAGKRRYAILVVPSLLPYNNHWITLVVVRLGVDEIVLLRMDGMNGEDEEPGNLGAFSEGPCSGSRNVTEWVVRKFLLPSLAD